MKDFKPTGRFGRLFVFFNALYWAQVMQIYSSLARFCVVMFPLNMRDYNIMFTVSDSLTRANSSYSQYSIAFSKWEVSSGILNCRNRSCSSSDLEYLTAFEARLFKFRELLSDGCRWFIWEFSSLSGPGLHWISMWIVRSTQNKLPGSMSTVLPCLLSFEIE